MSALKGNSNRKKYNKKPLVMTFHGWTGSGKNFMSELIASHMFSNEKVKKLRYHLINGQTDFPLVAEITTYKVIILNYYSSVKTDNIRILFLSMIGCAGIILGESLKLYTLGYEINKYQQISKQLE